MDKLHLFDGKIDADGLPRRFNNPFSYRPHPLCVRAADEVRRHVAGNPLLCGEAASGKMFGVLVVRDKVGEYGFLAAFSGLIGGSNRQDFFVPPVFDFLSPSGYFKREEHEISLLNSKISSLKASAEYVAAVQTLQRAIVQRDESLAAEREAMQRAKAAREERRAAGNLSDEEQEKLLDESRFAKAEYRRNIKRWDERLVAYKEEVALFEQRISALKDERKRRSAALQQWLFDNFILLNAAGEKSSLSCIFSETPQGVPPAGAGECAAPKLLQYAFSNGLVPVAMAEFWMGASPVGEVRRDGCFYGSCISKCKPILGFMLRGMDVESSLPEALQSAADIDILYEDDYLLAVDKPSGMLSVPGIDGGVSLEEYLCEKYSGKADIRVVHRLDMATSGVLLVAKQQPVFVELQRMFATRQVQKRYVALLDGVPSQSEGEISLPLAPDYINRPRQMVDRLNGKNALTLYKVSGTVEYEGRQCARVHFFPVTGRTHQLRVHSAYFQGLDTPIVGDELYGSADKRLMLHADYISFVHPVTGKRVEIESSAGF